MMNGEARVLHAAEEEHLAEAARCLREGGVVVIPTDTVYGLACSALDDDAIARVFAVKRRAPDAAVPVLLASAADLPTVTADTPRAAWQLIDRFWPGGLTLVFPARPGVSRVLTAGGDTVAVRVPAARSCLRILEQAGLPLVGTSANVSGEPPALTAEQAFASLGGFVDIIVEDDAAVRGGVPSTVVEIVDGRPVIHRVGALSADAIRQAIGARAEVMRRLPSGSG